MRYSWTTARRYPGSCAQVDNPDRCEPVSSIRREHSHSRPFPRRLQQGCSAHLVDQAQASATPEISRRASGNSPARSYARLRLKCASLCWGPSFVADCESGYCGVELMALHVEKAKVQEEIPLAQSEFFGAQIFAQFPRRDRGSFRKQTPGDSGQAHRSDCAAGHFRVAGLPPDSLRPPTHSRR